MPEENSHDYRERIYRSYDSARLTPVAPVNVADLTPRTHLLKYLIRNFFPINRDCSILDLGCGHGALLYVLQQYGYQHARGVDVSQEQVDAARHLGIAGVERGDIMTVLTEAVDASFDVIVSFDVIEHFRKSELIYLIDHVFRILKPGGRWIIHVPNAEGPFGSKVLYSDFTHELAFTRISLDQLLRASGFAQVDCLEDRPVSHGIKSAFRLMLWHIIRLSLLSYVAVETGSFNRSAIFTQNMIAIARKGAGPRAIQNMAESKFRPSS